MFVKAIVPVDAEDLHEVFFEGLRVLPFVTGAAFPAILESNGSGFNFRPGEHDWLEL